MSFKPQYIIPFKNSEEEALAAYEKFIAKHKYYINKKFSVENAANYMKKVYLPVYVAKANVNGKATFEVTRAREGKDVSYTLERTGEAKIEDLVVSGNNLIFDEMLSCLGKYDFEKAVPYNESIASYAVIAESKYDDDDLAEYMESLIEDKFAKELQSSIKEHNSIYMSDSEAKVENMQIFTALIPVWVITIVDHKINYVILISGQNGNVTGDLPANTKKFYREWIIVGLLVAAILFAGIFCAEKVSAAETETTDTTLTEAQLEKHNGKRIIDNAGLLDEKDESNLSAWADESSEQYLVDFVILLEDQVTGDLQKYGEQYLMDYGFGIGETEDAVLFIYAENKNRCTVVTRGYASECINDYGMQLLSEQITEAMEDNFTKACGQFFETTEYLLKRAFRGNPYGEDDVKSYWDEWDFSEFTMSPVLGAICCLIIGAIVGLIVATKQKEKLIDMYIRDKSKVYNPVTQLKVTDSKDIKNN